MENKGKVIASFFLLMLLAVIFVTGWLFGRLNPDLIPNLPFTGKDDSVEKTMPEIIASITEIETVDPWQQNIKDYDIDSLQKPTVLELDSVYRKAHQAFEVRDYETFKQVASSYRLWNIENPKGEIYEGDEDIYFQVLDQTGVENFTNNAPLMNNFFSAPDLSMTLPSTLSEISKTDEISAKILDLQAKKITNIAGNSWNSIKLNYEVTENNYRSGSGVVTFLYEDGAWKYDFETWQLDYVKNQNVGDTVKPGVKVSSFDISNISGIPKEISIKIGDYVSWENANGVLFTVKPSTTHWNSPFLDSAKYTKQFNKSGSYTYVIMTPFTEIFRGTINVD